MLPFLFRHYDSWVDRYVIYDDGSMAGYASVPAYDIMENSLPAISPDTII